MRYTRRQVLQLAAAGAGAALLGSRVRVSAATNTAAYDDGTADIPGGLVGDPDRVIIVGAGWAGLTVANALRNAGVDHVLLEGRDRIGGRANTTDLAGVPIDLGCSWIHQPYNGNPMAKFADQAGVARRNGNIELDTPLMRFYDAYLDREVDLLAKNDAFGHALNFAAIEAAAIAEELGPDASVYDGAQVYLDRQQLQGDPRRQAEYTIRLISEVPDGYDWRRIALRYWAWANAEWEYQGAGQGDLPVGGYRGLIRAMAGTGDVRLGHRVVAISQGTSGVIVHADVGDRRVRVRGSHVVVAVPLGVLKSGSIVFRPGLPPAKREAIARIGFCAVEKVAMVFEEPFWNDLTHKHIAFLSDHAPLELPLFLDLHHTSGYPALIAFSGGLFAQRLHTMSADDALALTLARLREILGRDVPQPAAYAVTDWQGDPFALGAYSTMLLGGTPADVETLGEPHAGRVLFAGEATYRKRYRFADGALSSGVREAKRLLQRSSVQLSAG